MKNLVIIFAALAFLFSSCKKDNTSTPACPTGYTGVNCDVPLIPSMVTITKIELNNFPSFNPSTSKPWDSLSAPDIYFTINSGPSPDHSQFISNYINDVRTPPPYTTFTAGFPAVLPNANGSYSIAVWDYDGDELTSDDLIGGFTFSPNAFSSGFPTTINFHDNNFDFTLYVTWQFD